MLPPNIAEGRWNFDPPSSLNGCGFAFRRGQRFHVSATNDPAWWKASDEHTGKTGLVPANFVKLVDLPQPLVVPPIPLQTAVDQDSHIVDVLGLPSDTTCDVIKMMLFATCGASITGVHRHSDGDYLVCSSPVDAEKALLKGEVQLAPGVTVQFKTHVKAPTFAPTQIFAHNLPARVPFVTIKALLFAVAQVDVMDCDSLREGLVVLTCASAQHAQKLIALRSHPLVPGCTPTTFEAPPSPAPIPAPTGDGMVTGAGMITGTGMAAPSPIPESTSMPAPAPMPAPVNMLGPVTMPAPAPMPATAPMPAPVTLLGPVTGASASTGAAVTMPAMHQIHRIQIFHDAENCFFGNSQSLDVALLCNKVIAKIKSVAGLHHLLAGAQCWSWKMYLPKQDQNNRWHPSHKSVDALSNVGVSYICCPAKKDSVDTKMKDDLLVFSQGFRSQASSHLVVLLTGDRDFSGSLRALSFEGFRTMIFHCGGDRQLSPGVGSNADYQCDDWLKLLHDCGGQVPGSAAATCTAQSSTNQPLADKVCSVLATDANGISGANLPKLFRDMHGCDLDFKQLGHAKLTDYMRTLHGHVQILPHPTGLGPNTFKLISAPPRGVLHQQMGGGMVMGASQPPPPWHKYSAKYAYMRAIPVSFQMKLYVEQFILGKMRDWSIQQDHDSDVVTRLEAGGGGVVLVSANLPAHLEEQVCYLKQQLGQAATKTLTLRGVEPRQLTRGPSGDPRIVTVARHAGVLMYREPVVGAASGASTNPGAGGKGLLGSLNRKICRVLQNQQNQSLPSSVLALGGTGTGADAVLASNFSALFRAEYGRDLDYQSLGFSKASEFMRTMPGIEVLPKDRQPGPCYYRLLRPCPSSASSSSSTHPHQHQSLLKNAHEACKVLVKNVPMSVGDQHEVWRQVECRFRVSVTHVKLWHNKDPQAKTQIVELTMRSPAEATALVGNKFVVHALSTTLTFVEKRPKGGAGRDVSSGGFGGTVGGSGCGGSCSSIRVTLIGKEGKFPEVERELNAMQIITKRVSFGGCGGGCSGDWGGKGSPSSLTRFLQLASTQLFASTQRLLDVDLDLVQAMGGRSAGSNSNSNSTGNGNANCNCGGSCIDIEGQQSKVALASDWINQNWGRIEADGGDMLIQKLHPEGALQQSAGLLRALVDLVSAIKDGLTNRRAMLVYIEAFDVNQGNLVTQYAKCEGMPQHSAAVASIVCHVVTITRHRKAFRSATTQIADLIDTFVEVEIDFSRFSPPAPAGVDFGPHAQAQAHARNAQAQAQFEEKLQLHQPEHILAFKKEHGLTNVLFGVSTNGGASAPAPAPAPAPVEAPQLLHAHAHGGNTPRRVLRLMGKQDAVDNARAQLENLMRGLTLSTRTLECRKPWWPAIFNEDGPYHAQLVAIGNQVIAASGIGGAHLTLKIPHALGGGNTDKPALARLHGPAADVSAAYPRMVAKVDELVAGITHASKQLLAPERAFLDEDTAAELKLEEWCKTRGVYYRIGWTSDALLRSIRPHAGTGAGAGAGAVVNPGAGTNDVHGHHNQQSAARSLRPLLQWQDEHGLWHGYTAEVQDRIAKACDAGTSNTTFSIKHGLHGSHSQRYVIDFVRLTQTNTNSGVSKPVRWAQDPQSHAPNGAGASTEDDNSGDLGAWCIIPPTTSAVPPTVVALHASVGVAPAACAPPTTTITTSSSTTSSSSGIIHLDVVLGDILSVNCAAIVNPANEELDHAGGLAAHIHRAAGPALLDAACAHALHGLPGGRLAPGSAVSTSSCNLAQLPFHGSNSSIRHIIHTVGSRYIPGAANLTARSVLQNAITSALKLAADLGVDSVAVPFVGAGIFGWGSNLTEAARLITCAVARWASNGGTGGDHGAIKRIVLCDVNRAHVQALAGQVEVLAQQTSGQQQSNAAHHLSTSASPPTKAVQVRQQQWSWKNDHGTFTKYDPDQNTQLEAAYDDYFQQHGVNGNARVNPRVTITGDTGGKFSDSKHKPAGARGPIYIVEFLDKCDATKFSPRQCNAVSGFEREVKREPVAEGSTDPARYITVHRPLAPDGVPPTLTPQAAAANSLTQQAVHIQIPAKQPLGTSTAISGGCQLSSNAAGSSSSSSGSGSGNVVTFFGFERDVQAVVGMLDRLIADAWCRSDPVRILDPEVDEEKVYAAVAARAEELGVQLERLGHGHGGGDGHGDSTSSPRAYVVRAVGQSMLRKAEVEIKQACVNAEVDFKRQRDAPPDDWEDQEDDGAAFQLFNVAKGTAEWVRAEAGMNSHGFGCTVVKIERVQHVQLWQEYAQRRCKIAGKNGGDPNEKLFVKHGTSKTDPLVIAKSDVGIDPRYSGTCMYGRGAYFAEEADYTHRANGGYAYKIPGTSNCQMFLCRIAAGKVEQKIESISSYSAAFQNIKHPSSGYHSVRAPVLGNQQAYILYSFYESYPEYLVTYSKA